MLYRIAIFSKYHDTSIYQYVLYITMQDVALVVDRRLVIILTLEEVMWSLLFSCQAHSDESS